MTTQIKTGCEICGKEMELLDPLENWGICKNGAMLPLCKECSTLMELSIKKLQEHYGTTTKE